MKLGLNSVLFGAWDMETAFKYTAMAGYDGIEVSAIGGMSQHLVLDNWRETAREARRLGREYGLELLAMEQPRQDPDTMEKAFQAANEAGIPVVNCGPGGKSDDEETFQQSIDSLGKPRQQSRKIRCNPLRQSPCGRSHLQHPNHPAGDGSHLISRLWH